MYSDSWDENSCHSSELHFKTMEEADEFIEKVKKDEYKKIHQMFITESKQII